MRTGTTRELGFSLVELLVALVVTMLIAGGIFGLLYDANRTFGREPAVSEQQQNARIALAMIESDLISAGAGAGAFAQIFTPGLDDQNTDSQGTPSLPSAIRELEGAGGQWPDSLELRAAVDECQSAQMCSIGPGASSSGMAEFPDCMRVPGLVQLTDALGHSVTLWACVPGQGAATCPNAGGGGTYGHGNFPSGNNTPTGCYGPGTPCNEPPGDPYHGIQVPAWMTAITKVRYEIRVAADGVPSLWRSPTGGSVETAHGQCVPEGWNEGASDWQLVARGIEDLQVRYRNGTLAPGTGTAAWADDPGPVACQDAAGCTNPQLADYNTLVREVEVRISARLIAPGRQQGEIVAGGAAARRAELRTVIAPRAAQLALQGGGRFY